MTSRAIIFTLVVFNSPIEKSYDGCIVSPVIVAGGLPNLDMLSVYRVVLVGITG